MKGSQLQVDKVEVSRIYFRNVNPSIDEEIVRMTLRYRSDIHGFQSVSILRQRPPNNAPLQINVAMFSSLFTSCGEVLSQTLFPVNEKNGKGKTYITFADRNGAELAVRRHDGTAMPFGSGVMRVVADISCVYRIASFMYPKLKDLLIAEKDRIVAMNSLVEVSGPVEKGLKGATIKIETSEYELLGAAKVGFDRILAGQAVHFDDPDEFNLFRRSDGKKFIENLNGREDKKFIFKLVQIHLQLECSAAKRRFKMHKCK